MKKLTVFLAILALALFVAVPAMANSVVNGDFQTGTLAGWVNHATASPRTGFLIGDSYYAQSDPTYHTSGTHFYESEMYQIVDVSKLSDGSANPAWNPAGTSETYSFSFDWTRPDSTLVEYQLYVWTGAGVPTTFSNDSPGTGWTQIVDTILSSGDHSGTFTKTGCFEDSQPQYFAIGLEGQSNRQYVYPSYTYYNATFDNVVLTTECTPAVPVPPSALLLGSGLLGLVGFRFRNIFG